MAKRKMREKRKRTRCPLLAYQMFKYHHKAKLLYVQWDKAKVVKEKTFVMMLKSFVKERRKMVANTGTE